MTRQVSALKQLGIVLATQLGLAVLISVGVFGVDRVMSAEPEVAYHDDHSNCELVAEQDNRKQESAPVVRVSRGSSFKFLAF